MATAAAKLQFIAAILTASDPSCHPAYRHSVPIMIRHQWLGSRRGGRSCDHTALAIGLMVRRIAEAVAQTTRGPAAIRRVGPRQQQAEA